ncbi:nucleoprotein TPR [Gadus macrocephalus]|uniref:nucleoprotein TPR n=1 Tax=Gadus macrocephalus TaxID=80720 RepID=UPI0028CB8232|nr:nucleoprotein TPR [Gadus macrocephalus]
MAAQKENRLSPWRVNLTRDALDHFKRGREEDLRKSENRRMQLHCDVLKLQREQHLRAMRLQRRCQELTEREGRARRRNQQLLQDFQRAEATLGEMVAHTATMNTLRLEYQRYLEENSPRWHQQLKDHTQRAEKKRLEALLKDLLKREEEHVTASFTRERFSPPRENTHWPQRATSEPEAFCRAHGRPDAFVPLTMPSSSWLTQAHTSHDALCFPSPTVFPPPRPSPVHHQTSPQTGPPPRGAPQTNGTPPSVSSEVGSPPGLQAPGAPGALAGPSGWGRVLGGGAEAGGGGEPDAETWGENRKGGGKSSPQELDIKPVRLSSAHGDSSDGSRDSGDGRSQGERRRRKKEGRQPSSSDRKSSSQESAGASRSDSEVFITPTTTRGQRTNRGPYSGTPSETESRRGGMSVCERRAEKKTQSDPDQSGSHQEKSCRTLRVKSQSAAGESSSHTTEDEDPTDQSEGSRKERGQQKDSVSVKEKSRRDLTTDAQRTGEEAADVQGDQGGTDEDAKHTDEDSSTEDEENRLIEEREEEDEEESHREEDKEEEERGEDDEGQESEASGEEEGREQTGSSDSESEGDAMSRAKEEPENKERQAEVDDDGKELDEEEDGGGGGVCIYQPQEGEPEETDSDDSIVLPQEHRSIKVQSVSEEEEANSREEEEGTGGDGSVESSDSEEEEGEDIERLVAPRAETESKQENELKSLNKTKVVKEDPQIEESLLEQSDKQVQKAEDTDDEFDHFYD